MRNVETLLRPWIGNYLRGYSATLINAKDLFRQRGHYSCGTRGL